MLYRACKENFDEDHHICSTNFGGYLQDRVHTGLGRQPDKL